VEPTAPDAQPLDGRTSSPALERKSVELDPAALAGPAVDPAEGIEISVRRAGEHVGVAGLEVHFIDASLRAQDEWWDFEGQALRHGRRYRTDGAGVALVPEPQGEFCVVAFEPGRWGKVSHFDTTTRRAELVLASDPELVVRVLDPGGAGAGGVAVGLFARDRMGKAYVHELAETDADGRAGLHPARKRFDGPEAFVSLVSEDPAPARVEIDLRELPSEPVILRLPDTGTVEVLVTDDEGRPDESAEWARIEFESSDEAAAFQPSALAQAPVRSGRATLEHVRVGARFWALVGHLRSPVQELRRAGERCELVLRNPGAGPGIEVRVLEEPGVPLADGLVRCRDLDGPVAWQAGHVARTDANGLLRWSYSDAGTERTFRLELSSADRFRPPASARLELTPRPGRNDLGDVLLRPTPPLVGGTVVDEEGAPVVGADVTCGVLDPGRGSEPEWRHDLADTTDGEGRFAIHGPIGVAELFLAVNRAGYAAARDLAVRAGAADVRVVLVRQGKIAGRILLKDFQDRMGLQVLARSEADGHFFQGGLRSTGDGFEIPQLPAGSYTVLCRWNQDGSNVLLDEVAGVRVSAGETARDPRLDPLDLTAALHEIELEVVDTYGRSVREVFLTLRDPRRGPGESSGTFGPLRLSERSARRVKCPWPVADLELRAPGLRTAWIASVTEAVHVTLQPGFPVRLVSSDETAVLLAEHGVEIALQPADPGLWFNNPGFLPWDLGPGTELLVNEPGSYQVVLRVTRRSPAGPPKTETFVSRRALEILEHGGEESLVIEAPEGLRLFLDS